MGGETFPGRLNPPFRRISPLATLGVLIMTLTRPWIDKVRMSLASGATTHPFQEADLEELRAILGPRHLHERCPGQPFLLDLVSHLASLSGDPDWEFPLTLKEGVPLGVSDPTLTSPEFGRLRRSLREKPGWGKTPPRQWLMITTQRLNSLPVKSRQPFTRNEAWTWWTGPSLDPRRQRGAAANRRNFAQAPLRVGDCLHAIHWLRTAADHPHLLRAPLSGTEQKPRDVHQPVQGQSPGAEGPERGPDRRAPFPPTFPGTGEQVGTPDVAAADTGGNLHHPQGGCHQGSQAHKSAPERLEIPGGLHPEPVVGQQSGHVRHGLGTTVLGKKGILGAQTLVLHLPSLRWTGT